jgi:hypothetical protein
MNSSVIINDIRKRSIRLQRDHILDSIRNEEQFYETPLPQRIIIEAEERAREKTDSHSWKKTAFMVVFIGLSFYLIFRFMSQSIPPPLTAPKRKLPKLSTTIAVQTDQDLSPTPTTRLTFHMDEKLEKLKTEYSHTWKFERDYQPSWLLSPISGLMTIDFYNPDDNLCLDVIRYDMLAYPNSYHDSEETFENFIYERKLKAELCHKQGLDYQELVIQAGNI